MWDALAAKNFAKVRHLLKRNPELAMVQHPTTHKTPFMTILHAIASDDLQDRQLAQIMQLLLQTVSQRRQLDHAADAEMLGAVSGHRRHRAMVVMNLDRIMAASCTMPPADTV